MQVVCRCCLSAVVAGLTHAYWECLLLPLLPHAHANARENECHCSLTQSLTFRCSVHTTAEPHLLDCHSMKVTLPYAHFTLDGKAGNDTEALNKQVEHYITFVLLPGSEDWRPLIRHLLTNGSLLLKAAVTENCPFAHTEITTPDFKLCLSLAVTF